MYEKIVFMLTKQDLEQIDNLLKKRLEQTVPGMIEQTVPRMIEQTVPRIIQQTVPKMIRDEIMEFYDSIFEPFATRMEEYQIKNQQQHDEIVTEVKKLKKEVVILQEETYEIKVFIKDHEKRITKLEVINNIS